MRKSQRRAVLSLAAAAAATLVNSNTWAQSLYWDVNGPTAGATDDAAGIASGTWDNATTTNWSTDPAGTSATQAWASGNTAVFSAGTNATGASTVSVVNTIDGVNGITFTLGNVSLVPAATDAASTLQLTGPTISVNTATSATIGVVLAGNAGLTKTGAGGLTLSGANTFTGPVAVNAGVLTAATNSALGDAANTVALDGGTLKLGSAFDLTRTITLGAAGGTLDTGGFDTTAANAFQGAGAFTKTGAGALNVTANNAFPGALTVAGGSLNIGTTTQVVAGLTVTGGSLDGAGTVTSDAVTLQAGAVNAVLAGNGGITKSGTGTASLTTANLFTGNVNLNGGVLTAASDASLGNSSNALNFDGGTLRLGSAFDVTRAVTLNAGGGTIDTGGFNSTLNTALGGTGGFTKAGAGALNITASNAFPGALTVAGGSLNIGANSQVVAGLTVSGGSLDGTATVTSNAITLTGGTVNTVLDGNGGITKSGAGTASLTTANVFTGNVNLNAGVLTAATDASLGNSSNGLIFGGGTLRLGSAFNITDRTVTLNTTGTLDTGGFNSTLNTALGGTGGFTKAGTGTLTVAVPNAFPGNLGVSGGSLNIGANNQVVAGLTVSGGSLDGTATVTSNAITLTGGTVNTVLDGNGGITKSGAGTASLTTANVFTGNVNLTAGVLAVAADSRLGAASNPIAFAGGTLRTDAGYNEIPAARAITLGAGGGNINTNNNNVTLSASVSGTGLFTKSGAGVLTFNAANTYTGPLRITGGAVQASAANQLGNTANSAISLAAGTLRLGATFPVGTHTFNVGAGGGTVDTNGFDTTLAGVISGTGAFTKNGAGQLTLTAANTFTGPVNINGGVVSIAATNGLGAGTGTPGLITINGGAVQWTNPTSAGTIFSGTRSVSIGANGATIDVPVATPATYVVLYTPNATNGLVGTGTLTKTGVGEFRYQGPGIVNSTFSKLVVKQGLYRLGNNASTYDERVFGATPTELLRDQITLDGGSIGSSGLAISLSPTRGLTVTDTGGGFNGGGGGPITFLGPVSGSSVANVTTSGSGAMIWNGDNTSYAGGITNNGNFQLGTSSTGATLAFLQGTATTASITVATGKVLAFGANNANTAYSGNITGAGGFTKLGTGTHTILTKDYTNTGPVTVADGTLRYGDSAAGLSSSSLVTIGATGVLDANNVGDTIGALSGPAGAQVTNMASLTLASNANATYAGTLSGTGALTKGGTGTATLLGNSAGWTGPLTVTAGAVAINSDSALGAVPGVANAAAVTLNGGRLAAAGADVTLAPTRGVTVGANGGTIDTNGNNVTVSLLGGTGGLTKAGAGVLTTPAIRLASLTVNGGTASVAPVGGSAGVSVINSLSVTGAAGTIAASPGTTTPRANFVATAALDLNNNGLVVDYGTAETSPLDTIRQLITTGARGNDGADGEVTWGGLGITSSSAKAIARHQAPGAATALGYGEAAAYRLATGNQPFLGQTVDDSAVLVKYTYRGDADLNGVVNDLDVDAVVANYQDSANPGQYGTFFTNRTWAQGDFDYNGVTNDLDVDALAASFGQGPAFQITAAGLAKLTALRTAAVPEPTSAAVVGLGLAGLAMRRRKQ